VERPRCHVGSGKRWIVFPGRMIRLPPPRPVLWPLRPPESARTTTRVLDSGAREVIIEHAPLVGVTPEMLMWWYGHVVGTMRYADRSYPRYLVWHPLDHISYEIVEPASNGGVGPGARLHITEALGRNPRTLIDIVVTVEELGEAGAVVAKRVVGAPIVRLENLFEPAARATRYVSRLAIGGDALLSRVLLNRVARARAFPEWKVAPWIRHHIEEVGNLEHFLPDLFREYADEAPTSPSVHDGTVPA
jgi:hypothetical protein